MPCSNPVDVEREEVRATGPAPAEVRRSRSGRWRAAVLIGVHVAIALHIAHWADRGTSLSPLEPSEAMEFSKRGLINAGAVFFALTILSTAVLGRWFCGWACHVVALQDLARWLLLKVGIRPRPIQLGLLGLVPWLVFLYMFVGPLAYRALYGLDLGSTTVELTSESFWATFPGLVMAVLTFLVAGFAIVYFLGAKGFCTYGCPYGAIFGVADQFAPMRIRVTDACEGCGHCTSVCSSNVRVHLEVREHGAVVDPGCMKCLDCVSVCPMDALYVGWGAPALASKRRSADAQPSGERRRSSRPGVVRLAGTAAFSWATLSLLMLHGGEYDALLAGLLSAAAVLGALAFAGKSSRRAGPSAGEDLLLAATFLASMFVYRGLVPFPGVPEGIPLLLSLALSAITAFVTLTAWRMARRSSLRLQNLELRQAGRATPAGRVFVGLLVPFVLAWGWGGWAQWQAREASMDSEGQALRAREAFDEGVAQARAGRLEPALSAFERALELDPRFEAARENLAGMMCALGRYEEGIALYQEALRRNPDDPDTLVLLGRALAESGDSAGAREQWEAALRLRPGHPGAHLGLAILCEQAGDLEGARRHRALTAEGH